MIVNQLFSLSHPVIDSNGEAVKSPISFPSDIARLKPHTLCVILQTKPFPFTCVFTHSWFPFDSGMRTKRMVK